MNKKVAIVRCPSYNEETLLHSLKAAAELTGDLDVAGKTVLLKPNIVFDAPPEKAITTHPAFLEAAIKLVKEMGASKILVGDSPGLQAPGFAGKVSGLGAVTEKNSAEWVDFTKEKKEIFCPNGRVVKKFALTKAAEADVIVNLPKLKTHQLMCFTGAMKNLFGLVPSVSKSAFHVRFPSHKAFAAMIVDLNIALYSDQEGAKRMPVYSFMDAVVGMEGPGPAAGIPHHAGLVIASSNVLAVDIAASGIIGYPSAELPLNKEALARNFWLSSIDEIQYPGLSPDDVRIDNFVKIPVKKTLPQLVDFILPRPVRKLIESRSPGPEIDSRICTCCGDCSRICASQAVKLDANSGRMKIDYRRCIRCFCCHEICSFKAVKIEKTPKNKSL